MTTDDSISNRLQQFALDQLDLAITYLTDSRRNPDTAIHETRRCVKRVRALLRLIKTEFAAPSYDRENLYLRNIGRRLAALRDAAVVVETLAALQKEFAAQLPRRAWRTLKQQLATAHPASVQRKRNAMTAVVAKLRTARARVEKWALDFDAETVVQQGIRRAYQRGSRALEQAQEEPSAETFHEWRKQVNHLRHQLQLLQTLKLAKVKATLREFKSLAELLGRKNDLAVLSQHLDRSTATGGQPAEEPARPALQTLIQTRDAAYADEAMRLGEQLYARKAKAFLRHLGLGDLRSN